MGDGAKIKGDFLITAISKDIRKVLFLFSCQQSVPNVYFFGFFVRKGGKVSGYFFLDA